MGISVLNQDILLSVLDFQLVINDLELALKSFRFVGSNLQDHVSL